MEQQSEKRKRQRRRVIGLSLLFVGLCGTAAMLRPRPVTYHYPASGASLVNPFIGNVAWATDLSAHAQPFTLVYADVTWAMLEPEKGVFDFEAIEKRVHLAHWRAQGKHVVLRFVLDMPGSENHMDIPQWLYDETGDGEFYNMGYGQGYSPNYANPVLIEAHARAIAKLGERYGKDPAIAFVELGSLGHWGEWHVFEGLPPMPKTYIRAQYVAPYAQAFPRAYLLMRRPFHEAKTYGTGLFNDMCGHLEATEAWLSWIESGGAYDQTGEEKALVPMPNAWKTSPIGGEISSAVPFEKYLGELFEQTHSLFIRSHASWIGPFSFVNLERDGEQQTNLDALLKDMGYRLRVSQLDVSKSFLQNLRLQLTWENDGSAPFYFPWQPAILVRGQDGTEVIYPIPMRLTDVMPGAPHTARLSIPGRALPDGECTLYVGILQPGTGKAAVALAMDVPAEDRWYELGRVTVR